MALHFSYQIYAGVCQCSMGYIGLQG